MDGTIPKIEELTKLLKHQLQLYMQLADLLRTEHSAIVGVHLKELREATYAKEAIIDEIQREEQRRKLWLNDRAIGTGVSVKELTMERVASFYPDHFEALSSLKQTLIVLVNKAKEMNLDNKKLVENALNDTQELKKNILGLTSEKPQVYGPKGQFASQTKKKDNQNRLNKEA